MNKNVLVWFCIFFFFFFFKSDPEKQTLTLFLHADYFSVCYYWFYSHLLFLMLFLYLRNASICIITVFVLYWIVLRLNYLENIVWKKKKKKGEIIVIAFLSSSSSCLFTFKASVSLVPPLCLLVIFTSKFYVFSFGKKEKKIHVHKHSLNQWKHLYNCYMKSVTGTEKFQYSFILYQEKE